MKTFGNRQRLCLGGWTIAALFLVCLNGYRFINLESRPLEGNSRTIKALRSKLDRLDAAAEHARQVLSQIDTQAIFAAYHTQEGGERSDTSQPGNAQTGLAAVEQALLPVLTGIVQVLDQFGAPYFKAVLDGRVCQEQDRVKGFVVSKISPKGVFLQRFGGQWFIQSPNPFYTSDQGR